MHVRKDSKNMNWLRHVTDDRNRSLLFVIRCARRNRKRLVDEREKAHYLVYWLARQIDPHLRLIRSDPTEVRVIVNLQNDARSLRQGHGHAIGQHVRTGSRSPAT